MNKRLAAAVASTLLSLPLLVQAQAITKSQRVVNAAVPFLTLSPDSRAAAMGDAGVASMPDANSIYWNTAKLAYLDKSVGGSFSYAPWLRDLVNDMGLINATAFKKINKNQGASLSLTYFNQGLIEFTTNTGTPAGSFQSREMALTGGYGLKLAQDLGMGINVKYISSNLTGNQVINNQASKPGTTVASDISFYYKKDRPTRKERGTDVAFGLAFQNIGGKINYGRNYTYFLPANLKVGTGITVRPDASNSFNLLFDVNKLLVPTPTVNGTIPDISWSSAIFRSFNDAPDGMREELRELTASLGLEYNYENLFALRTGYFYEHATKGGRQYLTTGVGIKLKDSYGLDLAYLVPTTAGNPLANTWRLSLIFDLKSKKDLAAPSEEIIVD